MSIVRARIAPSPTGYLHVGTARTALFNYLFAKKSGGAFVVRIEDTDLERSDKKFEAEILESLEWLGITADESPSKGGDYGPYRQSERLDSYETYLRRFLDSGAAFYCPHSQAELDAEKKSRMAEGVSPVHWCDKRDSGGGGGSGIIRFKTERGRTITFTDMVRGEISFSSDLLGDFSIAKSIRTPLYNFAVVTDDADMKISQVIRGEDHIANTPKQILIQEALGFPRPIYAHLPLILGPDRSKLSKRHGATSIREFREQGYLPNALVNFIALIGWNPGGEREIFSMAELIERFDIAKVQKAGAVFDTTKLDWMNAEYIKRRPVQELAGIVQREGFLPDFSVSDTAGTIRVEQTRLKRLSDLRAPEKWYIKQPRPYETFLLRWKSMTDAEVKKSLGRSKAIVERIRDEKFHEENVIADYFLHEIGGGDKGILLWPLRVALTGLKESAGPFEIMAVLGRETTLLRIQQALEKVSAA